MAWVQRGSWLATFLVFVPTVLSGCNSLLGNPQPGTAGSGGSSVGSGGLGAGGTSTGGVLGSGGAAPESGGAAATGGAASGSGGENSATCTPACPTDQGCLNGTCEPILPECVDRTAGTAVCSEDGASAFTCGTNPVVREDEEVCEHFCSQGACASPPSCVGLSTTCGDAESGSCCASLLVPAGEYGRTPYDDFPATISDFRLDKYEVTVGRFRKFVAAMVGGWLPAAGSGKHTHLRDGAGLVGTQGEDEPGWNADWNLGGTTYRLFSGPGTEDDWTQSLQCSDDGYHTWTPAADLNEDRPINCLNWYQAAAFCIWDGGFLPSEAEWEYAAGGGDAERQFPWGPNQPDATLSAHYCLADGGIQDECTFADILPVGQLPDGDGRYGQSDLAGNMWEWNLDWFVSPHAILQCNDCTNTTAATDRVGRGGSWMSDDLSQGAYYRGYRAPDTGSEFYGVRCARVP